MPKLPSSDKEIERKIREIVKADERFRNAEVVIRVNSGEVLIKGSFFGFRDPSILKHKVAEIEGVIQIEIHAAFLTTRHQVGPTPILVVEDLKRHPREALCRYAA